MTSNEHSLIFSHGTLKLNESLKCGLRLHLKIGVFRFSMRLSPNCSQTLTYGSVFGRVKNSLVYMLQNYVLKYVWKILLDWKEDQPTLYTTVLQTATTSNDSPDFPLISFAFKFLAFTRLRVRMEFDG